jgi:hypothetical protein
MKTCSLDARSKGQSGSFLNKRYGNVDLGMAEGLLCSRSARPQKDREGSLVVLMLTERARSECARSTRAIEDQPGCP